MIYSHYCRTEVAKRGRLCARVQIVTIVGLRLLREEGFVLEYNMMYSHYCRTEVAKRRRLCARVQYDV